MDVPEEIQKITFDKNVEEDKTTKNNNEISINYVMTRWNWINVVVDNIFAYNVALDVKLKHENYEPTSIQECRQWKN